jgi:hypothetical protein
MFAATFASPWSALAEMEIEREKRQQRSGFVGLVGQWSPVDDNGPAFKVDGASWKGVTAKAELEAVGKTLFAGIANPFYTNGMADAAFPVAVWSDVRDFSNGTLHVQFKLVAGASDQTAGIVFGMQPNGEYLFLRYNTKEGNAAIWGYANGDRRVIARGTMTAKLPLNTWHELSLTVDGKKVTGTVSGAGQALAIGHTFDAPVTGRVGVWAKRDAVTIFKNFRVAR